MSDFEIRKIEHYCQALVPKPWFPNPPRPNPNPVQPSSNPKRAQKGTGADTKILGALGPDLIDSQSSYFLSRSHKKALILGTGGVRWLGLMGLYSLKCSWSIFNSIEKLLKSTPSHPSLINIYEQFPKINKMLKIWSHWHCTSAAVGLFTFF